MNQMNKCIVGLGAVLAMLASGGTASANRAYYTHGTVCQPGWGASGQLTYAEIGVGNISQFNAAVSCPIVGSGQTPYTYGGFASRAPVRNAAVRVIDGSTTTPLSCNVWGLDDQGWAAWSPPQYSCSQYGGCPDPTSTFTGQAWLLFNTDPFWVDEMLGVACWLPPPAPSTSWIENMTSTTSEL